MSAWQAITRAVLPSLVSGVVVGVIAILLSTSRTGERVRDILVILQIPFCILLLVLLWYMPELYARYAGVQLSPEVSVTYAIDLLVSVVVVASFIIALNLFNRSRLSRHLPNVSRDEM